MRTEVTEGALEEFFHELRRIREEPVSAAELEPSKRSIVASFALSLEQPARVLGFAITLKRYHLPADYWDQYPAKIMAISAADVQRVARKYLDPEAMQLVAVGDAAKIEPILTKYGKVDVFDTTGTGVSGAQP
jgi:predicted Zn-dependent peptidase